MTLDPPRAGPQSALSRLLEDYNPFYLLSAACMLFGVFACCDSLDWSPIGSRRLITMILTLNLYEAALIGLAILLMRRGVRRDSLLLLIVEAFFLADVGFLNMEVFATDARLGLVVNTLVLAAAIIKVALVFAAACIPLADGRFAFMLIQMAVLFGTPGIFAIVAQRHNDFLSPLALYCGWWLCGALPVAYVMTVGSVDVFRKRTDGFAAGHDMIVSRVMLVLPMLSLVAHLCLANWVYKVTFEPANLAPLLLGLAVMAGHADRHLGTLAARMRIQLALPLAAIALSAITLSPQMTFPLTARFNASPLRASLIVAAIVYAEGLWQFRHLYFAYFSGVCMAAACMGHNVATINDSSVRMAKSGGNTLQALIPKTLDQWGMVSIGASFALLAIGAWISFARRAVLHAEIIEVEVPDDPA